jgi:ribose 5-phosphate isomerase B
MKIAIGSDEATHLTDFLVRELEERGFEVELFGALRGENAPWPRVAEAVAEQVAGGRCQEGILLCWTGTGVSIAANKVPGIRAALCSDAETARGARKWNQANVLVMSLRLTPEAVAREILDAWFSTPPGEGEDAQQVAMVADIEHKYGREPYA